MSQPARGFPNGNLGRHGVDSRPEWRILQVFHTLGMGGAETWLVSLLEWFEEIERELPFRIRFDVCLTGSERAVLDDRVVELGARIHNLKYSRHRLLGFTREFRQLLATQHYHVIHDHADFAGGIHLLLGLGKLPNVRIVHVHNPQEALTLTLEQRVIRTVGRFAVKRLATAIAGTSLAALKEAHYPIVGSSSQPRLALHCGFDVRRFSLPRAAARTAIRQEFYWGDDTRLLLFVGRLESGFNQKNPEFALDVARACIDADARVRALFVGAGQDMRTRLEARVAGWGLSNEIRFLGVRLDVPRLMCGSDLLLFPSIAEGLGMVAVEAQAAGMRVLASNTTPTECEVVSGMVQFKPLGAPAEEWAGDAIELLNMPVPDAERCREIVKASPFAIGESARALLRLYGIADWWAA